MNNCCTILIIAYKCKFVSFGASITKNFNGPYSINDGLVTIDDISVLVNEINLNRKRKRSGRLYKSSIKAVQCFHLLFSYQFPFV